MAHDYQIIVRINFGPPEVYEDFYGTEAGVKFIVARLNKNFSVYGTRSYEFRRM